MIKCSLVNCSHTHLGVKRRKERGRNSFSFSRIKPPHGKGHQSNRLYIGSGSHSPIEGRSEIARERHRQNISRKIVEQQKSSPSASPGPLLMEGADVLACVISLCMFQAKKRDKWVSRKKGGGNKLSVMVVYLQPWTLVTSEKRPQWQV